MGERDFHEIPFRCLIPIGLKSLLVAGRCISSDFTAQSSYRIIANCRTMGEAAGVAAALAREQRLDITEVDGVEVRRRMIEHGLLPKWCEKAPAMAMR
jgi:hypothetical protein